MDGVRPDRLNDAGRLMRPARWATGRAVDRGRVWFPSLPDVGHVSWQTGPVAERSGRRRTGPAPGAEQR